MRLTNDQACQECLSVARALLAALEEHDLPLIERRSEEMRARLRSRDGVRYAADREKALLRQEQLEALEAALEGIEQSLVSLRQIAEDELSRMNAAYALLKHLALGEGPARRPLPEEGTVAILRAEGA